MLYAFEDLILTAIDDGSINVGHKSPLNRNAPFYETNNTQCCLFTIELFFPEWTKTLASETDQDGP